MYIYAWNHIVRQRRKANAHSAIYSSSISLRSVHSHNGVQQFARTRCLSLSLSTSFSLTLMIISQYIRIFILYDFHVRVHAYHICTIYVPYMSGFIHPEWLCCASLSDFAQCLDFIDRCFQMRYEYMNKSSLKHVFIWLERNFQNEGLIHFVQKRSNSLTMRFSVSSLLFLCSAALSDSNYHEYRYTHIVIENYISISRARFSNRSI